MSYVVNNYVDTKMKEFNFTIILLGLLLVNNSASANGCDDDIDQLAEWAFFNVPTDEWVKVRKIDRDPAFIIPPENSIVLVFDRKESKKSNIPYYIAIVENCEFVHMHTFNNLKTFGWRHLYWMKLPSTDRLRDLD